MPQAATEQNEEPQVDDRRAAIEAAFDKAAANDFGGDDTGEGKPATGSTPDDTPPAKATPAPEAAKPENAPVDEGQDDQPKYSVDKPPQSWRGPQKAKWESLDPDVRQEVIRREREVTKVLSDSAAARQLTNGFNEVITPFRARIEGFGVHPLVAVRELLIADHKLHTGSKVQRATLMAKLISDYDVDLETLDGVLAGAPPKPEDEVTSRVDKLLEERLRPFQTMMQQHEQTRQEQVRQTDAEIGQTLDAMAADTAKYPHYADVRNDMADIIELSANKKVYLTLDQAYNRAIAMNPELSQAAVSQRKNEDANERAQRALRASKSVGGAPTGAITPGVNANDRRATIAAAFEAHSGR